MKYYIDCEFLEYDKQPKLFNLFNIGDPIATTELISIALVAEDGREYYAECDHFNMAAALKHDFLPENVLPYLGPEEDRKGLIEIRRDILDFIKGDPKPQLVGWWSSFDWYVISRELFNTMGECMYTTKWWCYTDMKQLLWDDLRMTKVDVLNIVGTPKTAHHALSDARWLRDVDIKVPQRITDRLEKELMEVAHSSLCTLIPHVFSKFKQTESGDYIVPKEKAERWLNRSKTPFNQLSDKELRVPFREAEKYLNTFRTYHQTLLR